MSKVSPFRVRMSCFRIPDLDWPAVTAADDAFAIVAPDDAGEAAAETLLERE